MRTKIWFDIETTGFDEEKDEIHQISVKCGKRELNYYLRFKTPPSHDLPIPFNVRRVIIEDAMIEIFEFIKMTADMVDPPDKDGKRQGLTFAGKNPLFDWKFLMKQKLFKETWEKFFHYNLFDLTAVIYFLKDLGIILHKQSTKLEELVKYFQLKIDGEPHDSLFDVKATYEIYELAKRLVLEKKVRAPVISLTKGQKNFLKLMDTYTEKQIIESLNSKKDSKPKKVPTLEELYILMYNKKPPEMMFHDSTLMKLIPVDIMSKPSTMKKTKRKPFQRKKPGV